jgi:hypothetical protein
VFSSLKAAFHVKKINLATALQAAGFSPLLPEGAYYLPAAYLEPCLRPDVEAADVLVRAVGVGSPSEQPGAEPCPSCGHKGQFGQDDRRPAEGHDNCASNAGRSVSYQHDRMREIEPIANFVLSGTPAVCTSLFGLQLFPRVAHTLPRWKVEFFLIE